MLTHVKNISLITLITTCTCLHFHGHLQILLFLPQEINFIAIAIFVSIIIWINKRNGEITGRDLELLMAAMYNASSSFYSNALQSDWVSISWCSTENDQQIFIADLISLCILVHTALPRGERERERERETLNSVCCTYLLLLPACHLVPPSEPSRVYQQND